MALRTGGGLETASLVLTVDQMRRLRALRALRASPTNRVSLSDVAREVVEAGLAAVLRGPERSPDASGVVAGEEAAA